MYGKRKCNAAHSPTGQALHASYIDKAFVDMHREKLQHALSNCRAIARLADGTTTVVVDEVCKTTIMVIDSKGKKCTATIPLLVLPSSSTDIIVGLPHILAAFGDLFRDMIDLAITEAEGIETSLGILEATADYKDIPPEPPPWVYGKEPEAIEEIEVELPASFPWYLHYMVCPSDGALLPINITSKKFSGQPSKRKGLDAIIE